MPEDAGFACMVLAEARTSTGENKLLFQLICEDGELSILVKPKGIEDYFYIPIYALLEPFITDLEKLKDCTRLEKIRCTDCTKEEEKE